MQTRLRRHVPPIAATRSVSRREWVVRWTLACFVSGAFLLLLTLASLAQDKTQQGQRARVPKFSKSITSQIFFDDINTALVGERPTTLSAVAARPAGTPAAPTTGGGESAAGGGWNELISSTTLEDEIKKIKLIADKSITTPSDFAGRGHKVIRREFTILATMFAIIAEYKGDVRFKKSGSAARDLFGRTANNTKAGGNSNVYKEVKLRQADLQDLISGSPMSGGSEDPTEWDKVAARGPLMQRLESSYQERLTGWTSSKDEFESNMEDVLHEAEILAALAEVLTKEGMEDGDDEDYAGFAHRMRDAGKEIAAAVKSNNPEQARKAAGEIGKACSECHELYR